MATKKTKTTSEPRQVKDAAYKSFSLQKKITANQVGQLPSAWRIFRSSLGILKRNYKLFLGIIAWYGLINFVFVQGLSLSNGLDEAREAFSGIFNGGFSHVAVGATSFLYLVSSSSNANAAGGSYQLVWTLVVSLALIWTLRQLYAGHKVGIKDGFYKGMYPLVPFMLVLFVIAMQSLPMIIGGLLFTTVLGNSIATTWLEIGIWFTLLFSLVILSLYMISSSMFALYIVGLPDTTPMTALRSARQLVANRRWLVLRKALFLPMLLLVLEGLFMMPIIMFIPAVAVWVFFVITTVNMAIIHSYYYALYRSLL